MNYHEFLKTKEISAVSCGFEPETTNPKLYQWQNDIVRWACLKGRACIFADCGLGKTPMQLQWASEVVRHTNKPVLIIAPLAVAEQTRREGIKFGIDTKVCRTMKDVEYDKPNITNYEMLEHFDPSKFGGVVLDESSILKNKSGKIRQMITEQFENTPYKLCCTATPAPNDFMELGTHSEFMGVLTVAEMLTTFFIHDGGETAKWRLKGHAESKFFDWIASWACCLRNPADLGYDGSDFILPPLNVHEVVVQMDALTDDDGQEMLFCKTTQTLNERRAARRDSLAARVQAAAEIANADDGQVLVWCDLNDESAALTAAIDGAVEVRGDMSHEVKEQNMNAFTEQSARVLVSKPSIAGWGMNWQQCNKVIFVGLSDSFEAYYQAVRRCWRFGQKKPVEVYIVISDAEGAVKMNIERKRADAERLTANLIIHTREHLEHDIRQTARMSDTYTTTERMEIPTWIISEISA